MIENLCRNAAQVLVTRGAQNGRPTAIRLAAIRTDNVALIEISDTGPGFAPEQTAHIFEPFHLTTREGGTGLGLAIAADLVVQRAGSREAQRGPEHDDDPDGADDDDRRVVQGECDYS